MRHTIFLLFLLLAPTLKAQELPTTFSWVGNSFGSARGEKAGKAVQNNMVDLFVAADGTCYTVSQWDEAKREGGIYKDGDVIGRLSSLHPGEGGSTACAVTGDGEFIYVANGKSIRRYKPDGAPAKFDGGIDNKDGGASMRVGEAPARGLAAAGGKLFACIPTFNQVKVFDTAGMTPAFEFEAENPWRIAVERDGDLWVAQRPTDTAPGQVACYSATGKRKDQTITGGAGFDPTSLCFDKAGNLLVADNGPSQQIRIYGDLNGTPRQTGAFGQEGGIFSDPPGIVAPRKFIGLTGIGLDGEGNLYVAQNRFGPEVNSHSTGAGSILEKYTGKGELAWKLVGLEFVDSGAFDPETGDIYSKYSHYKMDYSKAGDGAEWTWYSHLLNQFKYPEDHRYRKALGGHDFETAAFVRTLGGRKFLFTTEMHADYLGVYRLDTSGGGEIAVPSAAVSAKPGGAPNAPGKNKDGEEWFWRDRDGEGDMDASEYELFSKYKIQSTVGWWIDAKGDLWQSQFYLEDTIFRTPFGGLDEHGNPIYDRSTRTGEKPPAPFQPDKESAVMRLEFFPETDTMFLAGYTAEQPAKGGFNQKLIGKVIVKYSGWKKGNRTPDWVTVLQSYGKGPASMRACGDYVFVTHDGNPYYNFSGFVEVYRASDGGFVGRINPPSNSNGRVDIAYGIDVMKRANGEYIIVVEDDWHAKLALFRWRP